MTKAQRRRYPSNWDELSRECKEKAGWKCEHCGVDQYTLLTSKRGIPYVVYLHAAHKHHDTRNPFPELIALCPACHARMDYQHKEREARIALERLRHRLSLARRGYLLNMKEIFTWL
jgi:predicted HNH restriction endonuclease